jgi:hypothetical protein
MTIAFWIPVFTGMTEKIIYRSVRDTTIGTALILFGYRNSSIASIGDLTEACGVSSTAV